MRKALLILIVLFGVFLAIGCADTEDAVEEPIEDDVEEVEGDMEEPIGEEEGLIEEDEELIQED
jgi:hypothetical protein